MRVDGALRMSRKDLRLMNAASQRKGSVTCEQEAPMGKFFEMFRRSPFEPLREHMTAVMDCVRLVQPMFQAVRDGHGDKLESLSKQVFKSEHEADIIKDDIRQTIPKTFYLPVYRGDLLGFLKLQDDMADIAEDLAVLLTMKHIELPRAITDMAMGYVNTVDRVCEQSHDLTGRFKEVIEHGLPEDQVEKALETVKEVEKAEWESDREQYKLSQALFALEHEISPIDIMLWFKIFGELGALANAAESLADRIRRMLTSR